MIPSIRFVLFRGRNKQHYFRIVSRNGKTMAQSEGYKSKQACQRTAQRIAAISRPDGAPKRDVAFFDK